MTEHGAAALLWHTDSVATDANPGTANPVQVVKRATRKGTGALLIQLSAQLQSWRQ